MESIFVKKDEVVNLLSGFGKLIQEVSDWIRWDESWEERKRRQMVDGDANLNSLSYERQGSRSS